MLEVRNTIRIDYDANGTMWHVVDLDVSTAAELPALGDVVGGGKVLPTSTANIIRAGGWVRLDEDGKWYNADGSGEVSTDATSNTSSLASPSVIGKGVLLGQGKSILTADEPEHIEPEIDEKEQTEKDELDTEEGEVE